MDVPPDLFITVADVTRVYCAKGQARWFPRHGIDYQAYIRNGGIPASELLEKGDALAERVVRVRLARGR